MNQIFIEDYPPAIHRSQPEPEVRSAKSSGWTTGMDVLDFLEENFADVGEDEEASPYDAELTAYLKEDTVTMEALQYWKVLYFV